MISSRTAAALLVVLAAGSASAFTAPSAFARGTSARTSSLSSMSFDDDDNNVVASSFDPLHLADHDSSVDVFTNADSDSEQQFAKAIAAASLAWSASTGVASAAGPDWGIFEGRTGSLLHPIVMGCMFLLSLSTGFLGLQWRRQRELGDEISALRKSLPDFGEYGSASAALEAARGAEEVDAAAVAMYEKALPVEKQIGELAEERKELSSQGLRDKHYGQGAILAFLGTAFAIEGPLNTYARAGKLFPGPHLYAGAGCVVLWSLAAACVPSMSKGNDTARSIHIAANAVGTGLFGWQVLTGWPILLKVVELTKWP